MVDLNGVKELKAIKKTPKLVFGANVTIQDAIETFRAMAEKDPENYSYGALIGDHWEKVANRAIRNIGSIAGNLMLKYEHRDFPSDLFITLEAIGAKIKVQSFGGQSTEVSPEQWLKSIDMKDKIIVEIIMPSLSKAFVYRYNSCVFYPPCPDRIGDHYCIATHDVRPSVRKAKTCDNATWGLVGH